MFAGGKAQSGTDLSWVAYAAAASCCGLSNGFASLLTNGFQFATAGADDGSF